MGWGGNSGSSSLPHPGTSWERSWGILRTVSLRGSVLPASDVRARRAQELPLLFLEGEEIETEWPLDGMGKPPGCRRPLSEGRD